MKNQLNLIIPVYNEEEIINVVVKDWIKVLSQLNIIYSIKLFNDGSTDSTIKILNNLEKNYPDVIKVIDKKNSGHGSTILKGYTESLDSEWIFQVDSDNEMKAHYFAKLWENRNNFDLLIGKRIDRNSPLIRKIMSYISYLVVRVFYSKGIRDVNSPYRLMRTSAFKEILTSIPRETFAPNIIISGMASKKNLKIKSYKIPFDTRLTGVNSLNSSISKLFKISIKSFTETIIYAWNNKI